jgi:hypothetical protein
MNQPRFVVRDRAEIKEPFQSMYDKWTALCNRDKLLAQIVAAVGKYFWGKDVSFDGAAQSCDSYADADAYFRGEILPEILFIFRNDAANVLKDLKYGCKLVKKAIPDKDLDIMYESFSFIKKWKMAMDYVFYVMRQWGMSDDLYRPLHDHYQRYWLHLQKHLKADTESRVSAKNRLFDK